MFAIPPIIPIAAFLISSVELLPEKLVKLFVNRMH